MTRGDTSYELSNPSDYSSEDIDSEDEEELEEELEEEADILGNSNVREEEVEIGSDMEEVKDEDGRVKRQKGGRRGEEVEKSIQADVRLRRLNEDYKRRFKALLNRTHTDALAGKDIDEDEIKDVVGFEEVERGVRWNL
ncbi:MAG: hypothetical protein M1813_008243 [Trichoglossum hirsutum]|nr:MAG: hypothetical protein M1813_008243 [Trichoglossum hirsutum]